MQGVGFRWFVVREAAGLGLTGWTANEQDGSVTVVAEGEAAALEQLEARLRVGPPSAEVRELRSQLIRPTGEFDRFAIRSSAHRGD